MFMAEKMRYQAEKMRPGAGSDNGSQDIDENENNNNIVYICKMT